MPDQGTLLRSFLAVGVLFGSPVLVVAWTQLRHSRRDRGFLLVVGAAAALFVGGLLWLLLLVAPAGVPCPPLSSAAVEAVDSSCAMRSLSLQRGWPLVDAALAGLVGLSLTVALLAYRRRRLTATSVEYLVRDVLDRVR